MTTARIVISEHSTGQVLREYAEGMSDEEMQAAIERRRNIKRTDEERKAFWRDNFGRSPRVKAYHAYAPDGTLISCGVCELAA